jgi:hypothetical protein
LIVVIRVLFEVSGKVSHDNPDKFLIVVPDTVFLVVLDLVFLDVPDNMDYAASMGSAASIQD